MFSSTRSFSGSGGSGSGGGSGGGSLLFGADKKRRKTSSSSSTQKKPSLFERLAAESAPLPPARAIARFSGTLSSDEDEDEGGDGHRGGGVRLTYVGFSVAKIRQELFQCWMSEQPDAAQYRCADLVAAGAVEAVFAELARIACCCAPTRPRLFLEYARVRRGLHATFLRRQQEKQQARAMSAGFGIGGGNGSGGSRGGSSMLSSTGDAKKKGKGKKKPSASSSSSSTSFLSARRGADGAEEVLGTETVDWVVFRNDAGLRRALSRLVLLVYLSVDETVTVYAPPPFVPQDEFDAGRLRSMVEADGAHYGKPVLRHEDSPKVHVAVNELLFHLTTTSASQSQSAAKSAAGQHALQKVCYWMQWLVLRKELVCAERSQFCGGAGNGATVAKVAVHPVWIVWEAMYHVAGHHRRGTMHQSASSSSSSSSQQQQPTLLEMLDALSAEYCRGYRGTAAVLKQRMHILYCAARLALFGADWGAPLLRGGDAAYRQDVEARIDLDTDRSYRLVQHERAKVVAAAAAAAAAAEDGDDTR